MRSQVDEAGEPALHQGKLGRGELGEQLFLQSRQHALGRRAEGGGVGRKEHARGACVQLVTT